MTRVRWLLGIFLIILGLVAPAGGESPTGESLVQLKDVTVEPKDDGLTVRLHTTGPAKYRHSLIDTPFRVVIDLEGTRYGWRKIPLTVDAEPVRQIRGSQYRKGIARVVLQLSRKVAYQIDEGAEGLTVTFKPSRVAESKPGPAKVEPPKSKEKPAAKATPAKPAQKAMAKAAPPTDEAAAPAKPVIAEPQKPETAPPVTSVQIDPGTAPGLPRLAQAQSAQPPSPPGPRLISFDFKDADIVNVFRILASESGKNFVVGDDVKGKISLTLKNVTWDLAMEIILEARGLQKIERNNVIRIVTTEQLTKEREAKAKAEEAKLKGEAEVRAKLAEAQLKEQEAQQRAYAAESARKEAEARGPLKEELIRLAYRDPEEVAKTLAGLLGIAEGAVPVTAAPGGPPPIAEPPFSALYGPGAQPPPARPGPTPPAELLAKGITIRADKPTNSVFIRHYEADLERIKKLIREKLDVPLPQVKIAARLNILSRTDLFDIGIQWGGAGTMRDSNKKVLVAQGFATTPAGTTTVSPPIETATGTRVPLTAFLPVDKFTGLPLGGNIVNLPLTAGDPAGAISFGFIGTRLSLNLILQALEEERKTRSLSKPEIVTVENAKALISLGEEIPYATVSSAGTQIQFKEAVLKLEVTPTVIQEPGVTKIKMKVLVEDNSRGALVNSPAGAIPAIQKRKAETEVIIKEGGTLVIGGITQRSQLETTTKVPLLGDIPLLGWLFKKKSIDLNPNQELIVFITPTVVKTEPPRPARSQSDKPKGS